MACAECLSCGEMGNWTRCPYCGSSNISYDEDFRDG